MKNDNDFGFSFTDENHTDKSVGRIEALEECILSLEGIIMPLLENLKKNPEKPYIKWENRIPVIDEQINRIKAITRGIKRNDQ